MDIKSEDIFNDDIDASIWLSYELDKLNLDIQLDIESALLSVENIKVNETTNSFKDTKKQDLKMSVTNVQTVVEEPTQETELEKKDINGNQKSLSDEKFIQLFDELELSDTDNEAVDEEEDEAVDEEDDEAVDKEDNEAVEEEYNEVVDEEDNEAVDEEDDEGVDEENNEAVGEKGSGLIERGPAPKRVTKGKNRTNYLPSNERYDRSQFPPSNLKYWSGSTLVQSYDTPLTVIEPILNISETNLTLSSTDSLSSLSPVVYEDLGASAFGSPESGYDSSITGSPPEISSPVVSSSGLPPETDDIDLLFENTPESALTDHNIQRCDTDDKNRKEEIRKLVNYLKDTPEGLNESSDACSNKDCVPLVNSNNNACSRNSSPHLRHVENRIRIEYRLENKARTALYQFLSDSEYKAVQERIYRQINNDIANHREVEIIKVVDEEDGISENRTNLHHAVINSYIEEIFCLIEIQKQYKKPLSDINIRDKYGKTALDYAVGNNNMSLVVDYLKENTACHSLNI